MATNLYCASDPMIKDQFFWLMQVRGNLASKIEVKFNGAYDDQRDVPKPNTIMAQVGYWVPVEASTLEISTISHSVPKGQNWCLFSFLRDRGACFVKFRGVYDTLEEAEKRRKEMAGWEIVWPAIIANAHDWVEVK